MNDSTTTNKSALILAFWLFIGNVASLIFMGQYNHVSGVATFVNWCPSLFSLLASIIIITTLTWEYLFEDEHALTTTKILLLGSGIFFQLISVVILTVINWQASDDVDLKLDLFNSYDLELGTGEDVDAMVQILATFSTCYNWLVTFGVSFVVLAHLKMVKAREDDKCEQDEIKKKV